MQEGTHNAGCGVECRMKVNKQMFLIRSGYDPLLPALQHRISNSESNLKPLLPANRNVRRRKSSSSSTLLHVTSPTRALKSTNCLFCSSGNPPRSLAEPWQYCAAPPIITSLASLKHLKSEIPPSTPSRRVFEKLVRNSKDFLGT